MMAIMNGKITSADYLLKQGADPNIRCKDGFSAYHYAIINANHQECELIENAGGDARFQNSAGISGVELAFGLRNLKGYSPMDTSLVEQHILKIDKYQDDIKRLESSGKGPLQIK